MDRKGSASAGIHAVEARMTRTKRKRRMKGAVGRGREEESKQSPWSRGSLLTCTVFVSSTDEYGPDPTFPGQCIMQGERGMGEGDEKGAGADACLQLERRGRGVYL